MKECKIRLKKERENEEVVKIMAETSVNKYVMNDELGTNNDDISKSLSKIPIDKANEDDYQSHLATIEINGTISLATHFLFGHSPNVETFEGEPLDESLTGIFKRKASRKDQTMPKQILKKP